MTTHPRETLPLDFRWMRAHGLRGLTPWYFREDNADYVAHWKKKYAEKYKKDLWAFATRGDREEVSAFEFDEVKQTWSVVVIDWGWNSTENRIHFGVTETYPTFMDWLKMALDESLDSLSEDDLRELNEANEP